MKKIKLDQPKCVCIAVDQGNFNVKSFGPGTNTEPFPTGLNHHGDVPPPMTVGSMMVNGQYYSITNERLQTRRDKTTDEDYYVLTLAAIANELRAAFPGGTEYECNVALALGLPVEHLSLRLDGGSLLREKYRTFFSNSGKPIHFMSDGVVFDIRIVDVGVYAQSISAAISDGKVYEQMLKSTRAYIIDIGGGTTNVISVIDRKPQNPGITLEDMGVLELFKLAHRTILEDCSRSIDDFMIDALMQEKKSCQPNIKDALERAKNEFVKKLILELEARKVDLYMGYICMVGGGSVLLYDAFHRYVTKLGNSDIVIIPDVKANTRGYYAQEMARLAAAGTEVYRGTAKA